MNIKRILGTLLIGAVVLTGSVFAADNSSTDYSKSIEFLTAVQVVDGYTAENSGESIDRIDFAKILAHIIWPDDNYYYDTERNYEDVAAEYKEMLSALADQKVMNGYDEYTFVPNQPVMYYEALKALVSTVGYGYRAELDGGYPNGYIAWAEKEEITKGIKDKSNHALTVGEAAVLVENTLKADVLTVSYNGGNPEYSIDENENLLSIKFDIYEGRGILKANEFSDIYGGTPVGEDTVRIDEDTYKIEDNGFNAYLGHKLKYYYKADKDDLSDRTLIYVSDVNTVNTLSINADEIDSFSERTYQYTSNGNYQSKKATIASDAVILYNNRVPQNKVGKELYIPTEGKVDLIDNDGDNKYDVVFIWNYETYVVNSVSAANYVINDYYGKQTLVLDPGNTDYTMSKNGEEIGIDKLEKWNVLSVARSDDDNPYLTIVVSDRRVTGKASFSGEYVTIDNQQYPISSVFNLKKATDSEYDYYLDFLGNMVAYDKNSSSSYWHKGIITAFRSESDYDEQPQIKVFTEDGQMVLYKTAKKINLDGTSGVQSLDIFLGGQQNALMDSEGLKPQMIKYRLNENNEVTYIDTVERGANEEDDSLNQSPFLKRGSGWVSMLVGHSWNETYAIVSGAPIFRVPSDENGNIVRGSQYDDLYSITQFYGALWMPFEDKGVYSVRFFDLNETNVTDLMIWYIPTDGSADVYNLEQFMVKGIGSAVNDKDEVVTTLNGWSVGQEKTLLIESGKDDIAKDLKPGDVINYVLNNYNEVKSITLITNPADRDDNGNPTYVLSQADFGNGTRCLYGQIASIDRENHVIMVKYQYDESGDLIGNGIVNVLNGTGYNAVVTKYNVERNVMDSGTWEDLQVGQSVILDKCETATRSIVIVEN